MACTPRRGVFMPRGLVRALGVELFAEGIEALLLLDCFAGGLAASRFKVRCMRSWRPFCCGLPGLMRLMAMPRRSHRRQASREEEAVGRGEGNRDCRADGGGSPRSLKRRSKALTGVFTDRLVGFAHEQEARGVVCHGEGIAVAPVAELNSPLKSAHQRSLGAAPVESSAPVGAVAAHALDQRRDDRGRHGWWRLRECGSRRRGGARGAL